MSEFSPRAIRGRVVVILEAFWALGWILAALIGTFVVPNPNGWRWALAIGVVPALYSLIIRWGTPESVRFLESKGRTDEAERVVAEFESSAALSTRTHADETASDNAPETPASNAQEATSIWSAPLRKRTLALCTVWFCINLSYYGAFIWIPSLLSAQGFSLVKSFAFTLIMTLAQLPGYAVAAYLIERWGAAPPSPYFWLVRRARQYATASRIRISSLSSAGASSRSSTWAHGARSTPLARKYSPPGCAAPAPARRPDWGASHQFWHRLSFHRSSLSAAPEYCSLFSRRRSLLRQ